jgi:hypothetical protein
LNSRLKSPWFEHTNDSFLFIVPSGIYLESLWLCTFFAG